MTDIAPASPIPDQDEELRRAVALAYRRVRQAGEKDGPAWLAARSAAMQLRPDLTLEEAGRRVTQIVAWAASQHGTWFWQGVGPNTEDARG